MTSQGSSKLKGKNGLENQNNITCIKKVILENFLSFQKDEVDFGNAKFVIIVGPNWSGKTSIFQAIKFALGSNERDDRYTKWSNFIRNGQSHAMVEVHVQTMGELIKIRRYVIKGQSPYFEMQHQNESEFKRIQAHEVQKEIKDWNINPDNQFAFVSQGKIDAIKNLKPTELCLFLEEGIGLKSLRDEILNQKMNVLTLNNDLKSLTSRKNTLNISLDLLTPKIERLEHKHKLLEVRQKFNDELLWANREQLEKDIVKIKQLITLLDTVIAEIKKKNEKSSHEIEDLAQKIEREDLKINKISKKLGELNYKRQELIDKIQNWQKEKILAKQKLDDVSKEVLGIEKRVDNFVKQKESLDSEITIIKGELTGLDSQIDTLIKEQGQLAKKIKLNKTLLDDYNNLMLEKKTIQQNIQANENVIDSLDDEINQLFQSFQDIDHKLEKNKWFLDNPSKNLLMGLDKQLNEVSSRLYKIESETKLLEIEKSKKIAKLKVLQSSLRERRVILPSSISILKEEIRKRELRVKGPLIEHLKYDDELSYAIESVLGEKLLYSFIAEDWDTLTLINRLKEKYKAYCNIYLTKKLNIVPLREVSFEGVLGYLAELIKIVDNDIDIKKVVYSKVKNCLVVKNYRSGREIYNKLGFKGKCVTLTGEQIISYKYAYETPYVKRLKGFLSAATQMEQSDVLESEIKSFNDEISKLRVEQSQIDTREREIFKKKEAFSDLLYIFHQKQRITAKKNQLYAQMHELENENSILKEKVKETQVKISELKKQTDPDFFKWNERINEIPPILASLNEEKKKWEIKLKENSDIATEVAEEMNQHKSELNAKKLDLIKLKEEFQKADKDAFETYRELENTEDMINKSEGNVLKSKEVKNQYQTKKSEIEKQNIQTTIQLEQENVKLNSMNQDLSTKEDDLARIESEIGPLISDQVMKIRPIDEINEDIQKVDKKLMSYMDIDDSLLIEKDQIIISLKELTKNRENIEKDIKAAIKTEAKLEKTYYVKFSGVLESLQTKVNQKFEDSQIKSYCSLELTGNFEDLGVNIKAATSKEQLKSFTALSGGQVSLISICLILSLQEIKPSPLCMLDEAGMFLDEKNSEVAYQLIKSTLEQNPIQLFMFLPKSSSALFLLAEKIIGIARVGKKEISSVFKPKIITKK
ncbi:MAG: hypothetical protein ACW986_09230 [Promethearchaeota archaeon]|jgi:chromosome segregation protein